MWVWVKIVKYIKIIWLWHLDTLFNGKLHSIICSPLYIPFGAFKLSCKRVLCILLKIWCLYASYSFCVRLFFYSLWLCNLLTIFHTFHSFDLSEYQSQFLSHSRIMSYVWYYSGISSNSLLECVIFLKQCSTVYYVLCVSNWSADHLCLYLRIHGFGCTASQDVYVQIVFKTRSCSKISCLIWNIKKQCIKHRSLLMTIVYDQCWGFIHYLTLFQMRQPSR